MARIRLRTLPVRCRDSRDPARRRIRQWRHLSRRPARRLVTRQRDHREPRRV